MKNINKNKFVLCALCFVLVMAMIPEAAQAQTSVTAPLTVPFDLVLGDNFEYGTAYQGQILNASGGTRFSRGESYTLKITYTASRDLEQELQLGLVDQSPASNYWKQLTWDDRTNPGGIVKIPASRAGQSTTATVTFTVTTNAANSTAQANTLVLMTDGSGRANTKNGGEKGPVTLRITEFVITKN